MAFKMLAVLVLCQLCALGEYFGGKTIDDRFMLLYSYCKTACR